MKEIRPVDINRVRSAIARRQAELLEEGIPIYYVENGVLAEELPSGQKRKPAGDPILRCSGKTQTLK
jgi:hypothetical protein